MKNRKAQAAIEFLSTYGWALLVIALILVALGWLGVFSPQNAISQFCQFSINSFECNDALVAWSATTPKLASLQVTNNFGRRVVVCGVHCSAAQPSPETGFPPDLVAPYLSIYANTCQPGITHTTADGTLATVMMEPGERAAISTQAFMPSCFDETGALRPPQVGSKYTGKLYVFYSYEGETTGKSRMVVGNLVTTVQPS
ncbi:MAG: hypothetical protein Q7T16_03345 [Candidatus Burarchaeum sp.]|nr:hypothetical protein [Candidatus Burarchaeum sp.]MDO8339667.1 hypothetical protein [Candidatus Burarchaeum sp.]